MKSSLLFFLLSLSPFLSAVDQSTITWAKELCHEYPELMWLASDDVNATEEGEMDPDKGWSMALFGKKYVEFDRTLLSLYTLELLHDGSENAYLKFVEKQVKRPLSYARFKRLHDDLDALLYSHISLGEDAVYKVLQVGLVLRDMGKSEHALKLFEKYGIFIKDQDHFYSEGLDFLFYQPILSPSFEQLPDDARRLLHQTRNIAHYGHITHLEGSLEMFANAKAYWKQGGNLYGLKFDQLIHLFDVAGALGHIEPYTSLVLTEDVVKTLEAVSESCSVLKGLDSAEKDAYLSYANTRLSWVGIDNTNEHSDITKAKLIAALRIYNEEDALHIEDSLNSLSKEKLNEILSGMANLDHSPYPTPTYIPALYLNYVNALEKKGFSRSDSIHTCISLAVPKVLEITHKYLEKTSYGKPLCFNTLAGLVKKDIDLFSKKITVDQNMEVVVLY